MLQEGAAQFGAVVGKSQVDMLLRYKDILAEWNKKMNLTAIEEDKDVIVKHFIDSFTILPYIKEGSKVIDVGSGAGFPGIPLKIASDSLDVTLLDSLEKRVKFTKTVIGQLGLKKMDALHGGAEDMGTAAPYREKYGVSVARAVAGLPVLLEYCLPFVSVGGIFIAMKGNSAEEVKNSERALDILGGEIERVVELTLPFSEIRRNIIIIESYDKLRQNILEKLVNR